MVMQTPWGEIPVEDAHAHLFSHNFFETLRSQQPQPASDVAALVTGLGWEAPPADNAALAQRWVQELDRYEVSKTVLMASVPKDEGSAAAVVQARPDRFYGYFLVNPLAPDAVERTRRGFGELGLRGLCLFPAMQGFSIQDERVRPLLELAAAPGRVVFVHCGVLSVGVRKKLGLPSPFDMSRSNPIDLHSVALKNPNVRFVIPHFGAGYFRETLMLGDLSPNVFVDTSSSNSWRKFLTPEPSLDTVFRQTLAVFGPERILFGSDSSFFPRGWNKPVFEAQAASLAEIGASTETALAIFGGNLARLLS
jgi:predicted TIM-barrel fold metal-dependent hydrolase